ncbi:hypothetical protein Droror1_Dr00000001 [Drosera rotundifolia]
MGEDFSVQISSNLVNRLLDDDKKPKKKIRKPKPRTAQEPKPAAKPLQKPSFDENGTPKPATPARWPGRPPVFLPLAPPQPPPAAPSSNPAVEEIRSVLRESERVLEKLQKHEDDMLKEVTERAKQLHEKEFKLPYQKPMPCLAEKDSCLACYEEHIKDPLKCADAVKRFKECARMVRLQTGSLN